MKFIAPFSVLTILCIFSAVDWIVGIPISNGADSSNGTESAQGQPSQDQAFPFKEYQNESKSYMVIDDMIIKRDPSRAGLVNQAWPDATVPYTFAYTITPQQRTQILQAMSEISAISCVKFRPATRDDTYNIEFRNDPMSQGCSSFVGWQNRKNQPVQLSTMCSKGNAIHEVYHALGFFHEQTRNDRDEYVIINFENIQPGFENNFKMDSELYPDAETSYWNSSYNYDSIMHYGKTYFSKNGQNTIDVVHNPDDTNPNKGDKMGQRDFISEGDKTMLRQKYGCSQPDPNATEDPEVDATTQKPTTNQNPMCQLQPNLPMCKKFKYSKSQ